MSSRLRLARPPQQQLAGRASGRLVFGRFPEALGFFRHPLFKGKFVLDAASFHDAILLTFHIRPSKSWIRFRSVPFPTFEGFSTLEPECLTVKFPEWLKRKLAIPP
jgi:hypothetical protein